MIPADPGPLGWAPAVTHATGLDPAALDLVLADGPRGLDLACVAGPDCLAQALRIALTTPLGADVLDAGFGFAGLRALAEETDPALARERVRVAVIQTLRRDTRITRIRSVRMAQTPGERALRVEAECDTAGDETLRVATEVTP